MSETATNSQPSQSVDAATAAHDALVSIVRLLARTTAREIVKLPGQPRDTVVLEPGDQQ